MFCRIPRRPDLHGGEAFRRGGEQERSGPRVPRAPLPGAAPQGEQTLNNPVVIKERFVSVRPPPSPPPPGLYTL